MWGIWTMSTTDNNPESEISSVDVGSEQNNNCTDIGTRKPSLYCRVKRKLIGRPRNVNDPHIFQKISTNQENYLP